MEADIANSTLARFFVHIKVQSNLGLQSRWAINLKTHVKPRNTVYLAVFLHIEAEQTSATLLDKSSEQVVTMLSNALDLKVAKKLKILC